MKKLGICIILLGLTVASSAQASSFVLKPNVFNVQVGKTFTLPVVVDPADKSQYTVRLSITFPPDLLEVTSFTFGQNWIALSQPRYDNLDNKQGILIKTAGFPKGFLSPTLFGTITFRAKGPGNSVISFDSQSFILDATNKSTLESRPQVKVVASEAPVTNAPAVQSLPNLPVEKGANIFDITAKPVLPAQKNVIPLVVLLAVAGVALILFVIFLIAKRRKKKDDNRIK